MSTLSVVRSGRELILEPIVLLMLLSVIAVAALFVALALFLRAIIFELEAIGGPATRFRRPQNFLGKIRMGLRAIEVETGHIVPQVTKLNSGLTAIRDGLRAIDSNLGGAIAAVSKQAPR
jgi:hypothetical protein